MMARPLDTSGLSDDSANVLRKRIEFEAAMQQHTQRLTETVEAKERRITELSSFIERLVADFKFNLQVINDLQDALASEQAKVVDTEQRVLRAEDEVSQHKAARALLEAELRRCRQQEEFLQAEHQRNTQDLSREVQELRAARDREAERWASEHRSAISELRAQREADAAAAKVLLHEETLRLQNEIATLRAEHAKALNDAKAKVAEAETLAKYHVERTAALSGDLEASRGYVAAERQRADDMTEQLREQLRRSEQQCRDLTRQVTQLEGLLAATEERHDATLRQENAKVNDLCLSLSAAESAHRIAQQQVETMKKMELEQSQRLREVSIEWENKHQEVCKSTSTRIRELEVALRASEGRYDELQRSASVSHSENARLEREVDRMRDQLRALESELVNASTNLQQANERLARVSAAEAKVAATLRSAEAKHRDELHVLESEVSRLTTEVQRMQREHLSTTQKWKDETSELRKQLASSEAARVGVDESLAELRRQNYPALVSQLREDNSQLQKRVALGEDERQTLLAHVKKMTAELANDPLIQDHQVKLRQIDQLHAELTQERTLRAAAEAAARDLRVDIENREKAFRERRATTGRAVSLDRRSASLGRYSGRSDLSAEDGADDDDGGHSSSTVARLRRELNGWRERCELLEEDLEIAIRERATAMAEVEQLRHRADLLARQRDDLTTLNARLNHEAKRLRGLTPSDHPLSLPSTATTTLAIGTREASSEQHVRHVDVAVGQDAATQPPSSRMPATSSQRRQGAMLPSTGLAISGSTMTPRGTSPHAVEPGLRKHRGNAVRNYNSLQPGGGE